MSTMKHRGSWIGAASAGLVTTGLLAATLFAPGAYAAPAQVTALSSSDRTIATRIPSLLTDNALGRSVSARIVDAVSGDVIFNQRPTTGMLPASNMKVITAVNALTTLGPHHRFATRVVRGNAPGSIVLVGGGDPLLTSSQLAVLAKRTAKKVTTGRTIKVYLDDYLYPAASYAPGWPSDYIPHNAANVSALAMLDDYSWDPAANAVSTFVSALSSSGVSARYAGHQDAPATASPVSVIRFNDVAHAVEKMLQVSENNVAEDLFRQVAVARHMEPSWLGASTAAVAQLRDLGIPTGSLVLADGSGLSRSDRLTTRTLTETLRLVVNPLHPELAGLVEGPWLPTAGRTGTLGSRYQGSISSCAAGELWAKTGTLFDTVALSGLTKGDDGRWKVFSFLVNDRPQDYDVMSTRYAVDNMAATVHGCH